MFDLEPVARRLDAKPHSFADVKLLWLWPERQTNRTFATILVDGHEHTISCADEIMTAYNVTHKVAREIEAGRKCHKLCIPRKLGHARVLERIHFFTGRGTPLAKHIGTFRCSGVFPVKIDRSGLKVDGDFVMNGTPDQFAQSDGFKCWDDLIGWLEHTADGVPSEATIITW